MKQRTVSMKVLSFFLVAAFWSVEGRACSNACTEEDGVPLAMPSAPAKTSLVELEGRVLSQESSFLVFGKSLATFSIPDAAGIKLGYSGSNGDRNVNITGEGMIFVPNKISPVPDQDLVVSAPELLESQYATLFDLSFTAVAVGPRVVLTTAHAWEVEDKTENGYPLPETFPNNTGFCDVPKAYEDGDRTADIALCYMDEILPLSRYETINLCDHVEGDSKEILLAGFGCYGICGSTPANGDLSLKSVLFEDAPGQHFLQAKTCLCDGDSGGPGFNHEDPESRVILGVNSKKGCGFDGYDCAILTSTASMKDWIIAWAKGEAEGQKSGKGVHKEVGGVDLDCPPPG